MNADQLNKIHEIINDLADGNTTGYLAYHDIEDIILERIIVTDADLPPDITVTEEMLGFRS